MTSVAYCYHAYVNVCICTYCMLRYAISFIGNLTVLLVAHVLPCGWYLGSPGGVLGKLCFTGKWAGPPPPPPFFFFFFL